MLKYVTRFIFLWLFAASVWAAPQNSVVSYDTEKDLLSIKTSDASLKAILGQITLRTGIETLMSPEAERKISTDIGPLPLERALKQFLKDIDHVIIYGASEASDKPLITRLEVLPRGDEADRGLMPVISIMKEASLQAAYHPTPEIFNIAQQRWKERLAKLPEEKRLLVEARYEEKLANIRKREERKKQRQAEREQRKQQRIAKKKERDEALKASDPEFYERRMKQREELRLQHQQGRVSQ